MPDELNDKIPTIEIRAELERWQDNKRRKYSRFTLAELSSIPWVGGFLSATASLQAESDQGRINELQRRWLEEHHSKIQMLGEALAEIVDRLEELGTEASRRIEDPSYLGIVGQGFRVWDEANTDDKRTIIKNILQNAGGTSLCSDDVVRLFIDWIASYHEIHFAVIREIYTNSGVSRGEIWENIYGELPREDSAEADLYRLLIRDLSTGGVIRQYRETTGDGRFLKKRSRAQSSRVMKSAFDYEEPYCLTELGRQFVHYTMEELVPRIGATHGESD